MEVLREVGELLGLQPSECIKLVMKNTTLVRRRQGVKLESTPPDLSVRPELQFVPCRRSNSSALRSRWRAPYRSAWRRWRCCCPSASPSWPPF